MPEPEPLRSVQVNVKLTPPVAERLDRLARRHQWPRARAAAILIERGLDAEGQPPDATAVPAA